MLERIGWEPLEGHRAKARVTILYWIVHRKLQVSYAHILGYQHAFFPDSVGMWGTTCPVIYVVDSDQVAKLHVLKTAPNSYIYSHLLYGIQYSSDIVQDPTRVSRTVCVWLNVSTTPGKGAYMHRYAQKWLFTGCWSDLNIGSEAGRAVP